MYIKGLKLLYANGDLPSSPDDELKLNYTFEKIN